MTEQSARRIFVWLLGTSAVIFVCVVLEFVAALAALASSGSAGMEFVLVAGAVALAASVAVVVLLAIVGGGLGRAAAICAVGYVLVTLVMIRVGGP